MQSTKRTLQATTTYLSYVCWQFPEYFRKYESTSPFHVFFIRPSRKRLASFSAEFVGSFSRYQLCKHIRVRESFSRAEFKDHLLTNRLFSLRRFDRRPHTRRLRSVAFCSQPVIVYLLFTLGGYFFRISLLLLASRSFHLLKIAVVLQRSYS